MVRVWLIEDMVVGASFFLSHLAATGNGRTLLGENLMAFHKKLPDERRMPGRPGTRRGMEASDLTCKQPGVHQDKGGEPLHTLQGGSYSLGASPVLPNNDKIA